MTVARVVSLYELLGMSEEHGERLMKELGIMFKDSESPPDLCKKVIDKYGVDAVFSSICLRMVLEKMSLVDGGSGGALQCPSRN